MTQAGLIDTIIETLGLDANSTQHQTPAVSPPLHKHEDKEKFNEDWHYRSLIGILTFLERNTRPVNVVVHNDINTKKIDEKLFQECVSALHSLGYNRRSAKKLADKVFQKHDVKTTQQFISLAFKEDV